MTPPTATSWQRLMQEGDAQLREGDTLEPNPANGGGTTTSRHEPRHEPDMAQTCPSFTPGQQGRNMITNVPQQPRSVSRQNVGAASSASYDQQHASRVFGQHDEPQSMQLQNSISYGPLPRMPTYESGAHQTLRQLAPKLQALLDLFATAYETHDMVKVEELRRRLNWAIDAKGA
ncbi:hypothetical protein CLAFUW4_05816 [Fulvia fulva]|uniref:Uncharacterized protein n=1 Tax=Passalora fulva TaxID=5499 RepID=A0A9Q8LH06_PASFU|nr:uncharacterized protein CLAFUR5_05957 [Fulvia fulva]KAK4624364.1 hypothetical protein CLAFUR4_05810 [Fulvia fulva]KAK4625791.1 hypothetical protein CLAFUR0_05821 [Fulvia fulva]UJO17284.1 hypothetical protein CLAFUR5_05957 [Fulvia fulva]WPV15562.1 hypothetical protein CLAFUW4_05816 [Fulvia fulva]WPV29647.1 hypothetical protein CLAFUW7_05814 [Fulvia fulva]